MKDKVRIYCDIDDTLWDLLPAWINFNNYMSKILPEMYSELSTDLERYDDWSFNGVFENTWKKANFFSLLEYNLMWDQVNTTKERINTLKKLNNHPNIDLYIVTSMKWSHSYKLQRFLQLFPFISDKQLITCHDKWLLDGDIWIDDKPETLDKCYEKGMIIRINKPYNQRTRCTLSIDDFSELSNNEWFAEMLEKSIKGERI